MRRDEYMKIRNGFQKSVGSSSKWITENVSRYTYNLLGKIKITETALSLFFSVLPPYQLKEICHELSGILPDEETDRRNYPGRGCINDLIDRITDLPKLLSPRKYREYEKKIISVVKKYYTVKARGPFLPKRLKRFADQFGLSGTETEIILFFLVQAQEETLSDLYNRFEGNDTIHFIAAAVGKNTQQIMQALNPENKLLRMHILETVRNHSRHGSCKDFELSEPILNYIYGLDPASFSRKIFTKDRGQVFPLHAFAVQEKQISIIKKLIESGGSCNILFYGKPGTGKTELARTVCNDTGRNCYFLKTKEEPDRRNPFGSSAANNRIILLQLAVNLLEDETGVLIVDEADDILNTAGMQAMLFGLSSPGSSEKGIINSILDGHNKKIIWISNSIRGIKDSVLRRFSYSLHFEKNSTAQRVIYWKSLVKKYKLSRVVPPETIKTLAASYKINAGHIGKALETFSKLKDENPDLGTLGEILDRQDELINYGRKTKTGFTAARPEFQLRFLNTDIAAERLLKAVSAAYGPDSKEAEHTGRTGINILLHGPPGTGKTEFAKYTAAALGKELIIKRSSDILSKWVGDNEQNIRDAFVEAEADRAVLCIDEADSFFRSRETSQSSWEVSFTNELLTQMENFSGVFICSTNLIDIVDPAAMRRFAWKVEFRPLRKEDRLEIVQAYFQFPVLSETDRTVFAGIHDLTPGDVKAVWLKYGTSPVLTPAEIAEELKRETGYRHAGGREIGFRE